MTPEVKERIEQIRNGNVPEGYKKTKVGIFPCEWNVQPLSKLLEFKNGINADKEKFGQGTKLISVRDILSDYPITYETIRGSVDVNEQQMEEYGVKYGDILFQRSSENYEDAGTSNVYLDPNNTAVFSGFVIRGKKISEYNPVYLNALLRTSYVRKAIIRQAAGAQHINIGQESLAKVHIALADDPEQKKIAAILTTQDKVIELKEKLFAEKQRQKKYLMQQLLTGKKRLLGFDEEWEKYVFSDIFSVIPSKSHQINSTEYLNEGKYPVVDQGKKKIIGFSNEDSKLLSCPEGGVIVFGDHTREIKYINFDFIVGADGTQLLRSSSEKASTIYLYYLLSSKKMPDDGYSRHLKYIKEYTYRLPNQDEQHEIVKILLTADHEIDILKHALEQEKQKKKALMQLLLTGIVRVKGE